jgi:hypothetical protein
LDARQSIDELKTQVEAAALAAIEKAGDAELQMIVD